MGGDHEDGWISFGDYLSVRRAEAFLGETGDHEGLTLDLEACRNVQIGAGWRLANAMRPLAEAGPITVRIPNPDGYSGAWFLAFTRSGLAHAIARRASHVVSPSADLTEELKHRYAEGVAQEARNFVALTGVQALGDLVGHRFATKIDPWLSLVNLTPAVLQRNDRRALLTLCQQSLENVVDHARRSPLSTRADVTAMFSLRYYGKSEPGVSAGPGVEFLQRVRSTRADSELQGFVEIVVADDGVGIAARQAQDSGITSGAIAAERAMLTEALRAGGSIKPKVGDAEIRGSDPGMGTQFILDALRTLGGFLELRTGRLAVVYDATSSHTPAFSIGTDVLTCLPGTALHVIIPVRAPQLSLGLD